MVVDILNRAVEADLLVKNVAVSINPIIDNEEKEEKRILSDDEVTILLDTAKGGQLYPFFVVVLGIGMRVMLKIVLLEKKWLLWARLFKLV